VVGIQDTQNMKDDILVPDPVFAEELGIHLRTLDRWDRDPDVGTPRAVKIRNRKYRWRSEIDHFKASRLKVA
jgi:hypothetical protein